MEKVNKRSKEVKNKFKFSKFKQVLKDPKNLKPLTITVCHVSC